MVLTFAKRLGRIGAQAGRHADDADADDAPVEAEIQLASRDIGFVRPGDPCTLKVGAFNFVEHGDGRGHRPMGQRRRLHDGQQGRRYASLLPGPGYVDGDQVEPRAGHVPADPRGHRRRSRRRQGRQTFASPCSLPQAGDRPGAGESMREP